MPGLSPRSHADDRHLAPKPTPVSDEGNLKQRSHYLIPPDVIVTHCKHPEPARHRTRSSFLVTSNVCPRPSPESIPIGHAPPNGLVQPIFRPPSRRSSFGCSPSLSRRDAGLKMLCVMQDES